jgi:hypothetical protein
MKIVKQIFRRPNAKRQAKAQADEKAKLPVHVKTIKKKALLIAVKDIREEVKGVIGGCQAASTRARHADKVQAESCRTEDEQVAVAQGPSSGC